MNKTIRYGSKIFSAFWILLVLIPGNLGGQGLQLQPHQQLARDILQEIIEINTVDSAGTTKAAKALERRLLEAGFAEEDVHVIGPSEKKMNLVARLRGRDTGRPAILLLAHIDVVEALRTDWNMDPWKLIEQDDHFYGRGVTDDKDEVAIYTANLIRYKQEGFVPDRDIIVALTADEEGGEFNGVQWLLENHRELIDAEYALNEGGGGEIKDGKHRLNAVQASEKVYQNFNLRSVNPGGHSSLPRDDNAIYDLANALIRIGEYRFPIMLNEVTEAYFKGTADVEGGSVAMNIATMLADPSNELAVARIQSEPGWNARLRTTCVATRLNGGHADNALPQTAEATVNCRMLPTHDPEEVLSSLRRVAGSQTEVTAMGRANPSPPSPLRASVLDPIQKITEEMWPGVPIVPIMATGATDGLYLRRAGIPTYGVSGIFTDVDDNRAHGQDERILIKSFFEGQEFLFQLVKALSSGANIS
jgi:acetylornithine deacetylase/succinyl-diaminopimelate desuccinylase-like protein